MMATSSDRTQNPIPAIGGIRPPQALCIEEEEEEEEEEICFI